MDSLPVLSILFDSSSFWNETVLWACLSLACLLTAGCLLYMRRNAFSTRVSHFRRDEGGAAAAVDFVLTIPIFMSLILFMIQLAMMANASLVVHYSAYSAARSARVWMLEDDHAFKELDCCGAKAFGFISVGAKIMDEVVGTDIGGKNARDRNVRIATTIPLISVSPANLKEGPRNPGSAWDQSKMTRMFAQMSGNDPRSIDMLVRKSQYAFDESNTLINYGLFDSDLTSKLITTLELASYLSETSIASIANLPVYAEVKFRYPLLLPLAARVFNNDDNPYARWMTAKVKLN